MIIIVKEKMMKEVDEEDEKDVLQEEGDADHEQGGEKMMEGG